MHAVLGYAGSLFVTWPGVNAEEKDRQTGGKWHTVWEKG